MLSSNKKGRFKWRKNILCPSSSVNFSTFPIHNFFVLKEIVSSKGTKKIVTTTKISFFRHEQQESWYCYRLKESFFINKRKSSPNDNNVLKRKLQWLFEIKALEGNDIAKMWKHLGLGLLPLFHLESRSFEDRRQKRDHFSSSKHYYENVFLPKDILFHLRNYFLKSVHQLLQCFQKIKTKKKKMKQKENNAPKRSLKSTWTKVLIQLNEFF